MANGLGLLRKPIKAHDLGRGKVNFTICELDVCQRRYDFADIRRLKNAGKQR
jgi:hypothetical protein